VGNPIEDAAFMTRIGAERRIADDGSVEYELKNAVTGTRFTFKWLQSDGHVRWSLERNDLCVTEAIT